MDKQLKVVFTKLRLVSYKKSRIISIFLLVILSGCAHPDIERAFKGDLRPGKANKVIWEYCQSCHIHKDFEQFRNRIHSPRFETLY